MSAHKTAPCPYCGRPTCVKGGLVWVAHLLPGVEKSAAEVASIGDRYCPMSDQHRAVNGFSFTDHRRRANQVCDLATQVRDRDPSVVWSVLTTIPADELQRLLMVALAGIDVEGRTVDDVYEWVRELPPTSVEPIPLPAKPAPELRYSGGLPAVRPDLYEWAVSA